MSGLVEAGYGVIDALQGLRSGWLDALAHGVSFLGDEPFYLLLLPTLYWAVHRGVALRLILLFLFSAWLNEMLKAVLDVPRPTPGRVAVLEARETGGIPSGHAQGSLVVWGYLLARWPVAGGPARSAFLLGVGLLLLLIGVSRLYLGAHFPHDVVAGWMIGALLLFAFMRHAPALEALVRAPGRRARAPEPRVQAPVRRAQAPTGRARNPTRRGGAAVRLARPGIAITVLALLLLLLSLLHAREAIAPAAALLGAGPGLAWERARIRFSSEGAAWRRAARVLVGLAGALLIWAGLSGLLAPLEESGRILRYALLGFWVAGAAPYLFARLKLARS